MPRNVELMVIPERSLGNYHELYEYYVCEFETLIARGIDIDADTRLSPLPPHWSDVVRALEMSRPGLSSQAYYQALRDALHPQAIVEEPAGPPDGLEQGELWDV